MSRLAYSDGTTWHDLPGPDSDLTLSGNNTWSGINHFDQNGGTSITPEARRVVGAGGEPAFENSWANASASFEDCQFWMDAQGVVHVSGYVDTGTAFGIFTLPVGYRPTVQLRAAAWEETPSVTAPTLRLLGILTSGSVGIQRASYPPAAPIGFRVAFRP